MKIGILGAGRVGKILASALAGKGHEITVGHRHPQLAEGAWHGPAVRHTSLVDAAASASLIINATPGDTALATLTDLKYALSGKTVIDVSNATTRLPNGMPGGLLYPESSLAEQLQSALPESNIVKTLNTMIFSVMAAPRSLAHPVQAFLSGNSHEAKAQVMDVLLDLGWEADWVLDLGPIESARATEALVLMVPHLMKARGMKPFAITATY